MGSPEARWQRFTTAMAGQLDGGQIADLLWMAQLLAPELGGNPTLSEPSPPAAASQRLSSSSEPAGTDGPLPPPPSAPPALSPHDAAAPPAPLPAAAPLHPLAPAEPLPPPEPLAPPKAAAAAALVEPATGTGSAPDGIPGVGVAEARLLPRPRRIGRALAPLSRWVETSTSRELDVPATVEAIARARVERSPWQPVLRCRREAWLHLHLVFDSHPSMALWQRLRRELPRTLAHHGRWRDLLTWFLSSNTKGELELRGPNGRRCAPGELRRPGGRDLVLVVSDAIAPSWRHGAMAHLLRRWGAQQPVVLLQVLPSHLWPRTGLGQGEAGWVRARRALEPNPCLRWQSFDTDLFPLEDTPEPPPGGTLTLPVATLDPEDLAAMARLLGGAADNSLRGVRFALPAADALCPPPSMAAAAAIGTEPDSAAIERQLMLFLFSASPAARRLLALLSYAPVITLPVVRLIQRQQVAGSGPAQIAEVLFSGLFRNVAAAPLPNAPVVPPDRQRLCFVDEALRLRLREGLRVREARQVFDAVSAHVAANLNLSQESFEALLRKPSPLPAGGDAELLQAFAQVAPRCLRGLGPRYEALADAIESGWEATRPLPDLELEPLPFETAWLEEIPLKPISFTTSTLREDTTRDWRWSRGSHGWRQIDSPGQSWAYPQPLRADGSLTLTLVRIPAGRFEMGSPSHEPDRLPSEGPQHEVTLETFLMSQTPITQAQWREVAGWEPMEGEHWRKLSHNPSRFSLYDRRPVENVSWDDAMEFCQRLSQRMGLCYTLPSEAQWEYACRSGTTTPFHFGATLTSRLANYNGERYANGSRGSWSAHTSPVAAFPANGWGLYDMHGNVWEWCLDHWHDNYKGAPVDGSAWLINGKAMGGERNAEQRLLRGGSWYFYPRFCRSAFRLRLTQDYRGDGVGFRVCCLPQAWIHST